MRGFIIAENTKSITHAHRLINALLRQLKYHVVVSGILQRVRQNSIAFNHHIQHCYFRLLFPLYGYIWNIKSLYNYCCLRESAINELYTWHSNLFCINYQVLLSPKAVLLHATLTFTDCELSVWCSLAAAATTTTASTWVAAWPNIKAMKRKKKKQHHQQHKQHQRQW